MAGEMKAAGGKTLRHIAGIVDADQKERNAARARALARQGKPNQALQGKEIDLHARLDHGASRFLHLAAARLGWSARSTHRVLKVARTIADLAGAAHAQVEHVAEAVQYRRGLLTAP